jgi:hypothetical protein
MSFSSFKELGFDCILLVEGVTDVRTIQQFLRVFGKDHKIVLLPLGGDQLARGNMDLELNEIKRISDKLAALVDSERQDEKAPLSKQRADFQEVCKKLKIQVCLTERRAIENYFSERAIKAVKGDKFRALGKYELLANAAQGWSKSENWKIAREMTKEEIENTDVGEFLKKL